MARKYVNPNHPVTLVTDKVLAGARAAAEAAARRLREAEGSNPSLPGWDSEYEAAAAAVRATERRVAALESLRAAQVERGGQRDAAAKGAAGELKEITAGLAASRDEVAAAAAGHLRALAALSSAAEAHNGLLARYRARLAELGLRVRDDLVDEGQEHAEGVLEGPGLRAGGVAWTPVPAPGVAAHALRLVFGGDFRGPFVATRHAWRAHEVWSRPDGLKVPSLKDAGATLPPAPPVPVLTSRPSIRDLDGSRETPADMDERKRTGFYPAGRR